MDPYMGEIRPFAFNYAPQGWALCNGQQVFIQQNPALYAIIGTRFGGDGRTYFNLPNLQGMVVNSFGASATVGLNFPWALHGGTEVETITQATSPSHDHTFNGAIAGSLSTKTVNAPTATGTAFLSNLFLAATSTTSVNGR
ncbi:MAG TPA: tail fiber protein, partial [Chitinophagaceae bacterium]|nr:tail fiber protein [Chitinophagaceae bacterium]